MRAIKHFRKSSSFFMASAFSLLLAAVIGGIIYLAVVVNNLALLGAAVILAALLFAVGFFLIGKFVVARVNHISETASDIMQTGNISKRITTDSNWDDISKLADVLNRMLDEIETLIFNTKCVTDNIAHELRTPLTRLRSDLHKVEDDALREELLKEADTLLAMFNGLLRIAEIETARKKSAFTIVDFSEVVEDAEALYAPLAQDKGLQVTTDINPCRVCGDRSLLFQACANIFDNAIKFSPQGQKVRITLTSENATVVLRVLDSGPGIPEREQEQVFRSFYRIDKSRHTAGHGLGLPIVKAVVQLHEGQIRFINQARGLIVEMILPQKV